MRHIIAQADKHVASLVYEAPSSFLRIYRVADSYIPHHLSQSVSRFKRTSHELQTTNHESRTSQHLYQARVVFLAFAGSIYQASIASKEYVSNNIHDIPSSRGTLWCIHPCEIKTRKLFKEKRRKKLEKRKEGNMPGSFIPDGRKEIEKGERRGRSKANSKCLNLLGTLFVGLFFSFFCKRSDKNVGIAVWCFG